MAIDLKLDSLLADGRTALAALNTNDRTVRGLVERLGALRFAEGTLAGFLDALVLRDPLAARQVAQKIEEFMSEAIAARILLD